MEMPRAHKSFTQTWLPMEDAPEHLQSLLGSTLHRINKMARHKQGQHNFSTAELPSVTPQCVHHHCSERVHASLCETSYREAMEGGGQGQRRQKPSLQEHRQGGEPNAFCNEDAFVNPLFTIDVALTQTSPDLDAQLLEALDNCGVPRTDSS